MNDFERSSAEIKIHLDQYRLDAVTFRDLNDNDPLLSEFVIVDYGPLTFFLGSSADATAFGVKVLAEAARLRAEHVQMQGEKTPALS